MAKIAVVGGGVSGSLFALIMQNKGHDVTLYDIKDNYFKPCGDVVPNVYSPPFPWSVKFRIKNFAFYLDGKRVYDVSYRTTKWISIDKSGWINSMRREIKNQVIGNVKPGNDYDYVIDAKGPYDMDRDVVYTTRAMIRVEDFNDEAILEFDSRYTGFYWIFPDSENVYNVGAGFLENKNSKALLMDYLAKKFRSFSLEDVRGAPISIGKAGNKSWRIGESRGLVFPMSGEGIRPSSISAEIAAKAIDREKDFNSYMSKNLETIERRIEIQRTLLNIYVRTKLPLRRMLFNTFFKNDILIDSFLEDKLDINGISESLRLIKDGGIIR
ncbi:MULTISPECIES: NAD(P)/FAD-dependent oxidoreductase [Acidianus]|uniref:Dehydrogenase n=1 Tax=Candidatus Acidianus copahuensis TaxID=1160895 RepID=A0A031LMK8_9CREN|nr:MULTISPECIES: NAD(P)/FAD-dependent oxidoreductase [Acidianus]EZQ06848.1 dehydrogenase [Candidatus Acidianus copahuensis]NON63639.1 NAD(P)/FAD-dependent oxidoreductase [Acidianus sp. RZ1]